MKRFFRIMIVAAVSVFFIMLLFRLTEAGSLTPASPPAGSMRTLSDIYDALAGVEYNSSAVGASRTGNALEIAKCIIQKVNTGIPCP